jgi:hypothetical protein
VMKCASIWMPYAGSFRSDSQPPSGQEVAALAAPHRPQERTYTFVPVAMHTLCNECRVTEANVYVRFCQADRR